MASDDWIEKALAEASGRLETEREGSDCLCKECRQNHLPPTHVLLKIDHLQTIVREEKTRHQREGAVLGFGAGMAVTALLFGLVLLAGSR